METVKMSGPIDEIEMEDVSLVRQYPWENQAKHLMLWILGVSLGYHSYWS